MFVARVILLVDIIFQTADFVRSLIKKEEVMKTFIQTLSPGAKVLTYFIVLWLATLVAGVIPQLNDFWFYFMIALVLSATFLHAESHSLMVLGIMPKRSGNWLQFFCWHCRRVLDACCDSIYYTLPHSRSVAHQQQY